jgi:hypothetical protein
VNVPPQVVTSTFGRTGAVGATSGDYVVEQITGAAPIDSPVFTGTPMTPGIAGVGSATFTVGIIESVVGAGATVSCSSGHICDSYSGTLQLLTGSGTISSYGTPAVTIALPSPRANFPNCLVTFATKSGNKPLAMVVDYPSTSTMTITSNIALTSLTAYDITYLCGGN